MHLADFALAVFALGVTLGLFGLAAFGMKRFGPDLLARFSAVQKDRRLRLVETLVLDPARRLVVVSFDGQEKLLLLGEGQVLPNVTKGRG